MVLISFILISKHLLKSRFIFLILLLSFMRMSALFLLTLFNICCCAIVNSLKYLVVIFTEANCSLFTFFYLNIQKYGFFFLELLIYDNNDTYPKMPPEINKKSKNHFCWMGRPILFHNTRVNTSTNFVGAVMNSITINVLPII